MLTRADFAVLIRVFFHREYLYFFNNFSVDSKCKDMINEPNNKDCLLFI